MKISGDQRFRARCRLGASRSPKPGPGRFRYLRLAGRSNWRQYPPQLNADNHWGRLAAKGRLFRYELVGRPPAAAVHRFTLPDERVIVTRDLFADFGPFKLTGIAFSPGPGGYGLFDHIYLARSLDDLKGCPGPIMPQKPLTIFEDQASFVANLNEGGGTGQLESADRYSGTSSVKITPDQRFNERLPGLRVKIAENPGSGEYRFLRYAWKKKGGTAICLQLNHDGQWGPTDKSPGKFRYFAGSGPEPYSAALQLDAKVPEEWVVVTRDFSPTSGCSR